MLATIILCAALDSAVPVLKDEIVVTPERGAARRDDVAASVTVLTRKDLDRLPAQSLPEVLNAIPGITMFFDGAAAGAPMITARGFFGGGEVEYVKLLIDGVPAGDVESGLIDWRHIRIDDLERIEVLRGPGSSLYGDTSMGGVIEVFTRHSAVNDEMHGQARLSAGDFGTRSADAFVRGNIGALRIGANALFATTAGYRDHSRSRDSGGDLTLQRLGNASRLQLTASLSSKDRQEPGPLTAAERAADRRASNAAFRFDREETQRRRIAAGYETFGAMATRTVLHADGRTTDFPRTLLLAPGFGSTLFRHLQTSGAGGTFEISREWTSASLRAGTDLDRGSLHESYSNVTDTGGRGASVAAADVHRDQTAFFATGDWTPLERLRFSAGVRRDDIRDELAGATHSRSAWSPRLGATLHFGTAEPLVLFLQLARAFKAPTLDQLFDPRPFPAGRATFTVSSPLLLPQRARNMEIGIRRSTPRTAWSVGAYRMNVTDEIDFDPTALRYKNIGSSRHSGVEAMAELRQGVVQPMVTYAWTRVESTDNPGQQLKNIPEHVAQLFLRATLPANVGATIGARWEHTRFADDEGRFPLPDVYTVNVKLDRPFGRLRAEVEAQNLFDRKYSYLGAILNDFRGNPTVLEFPAPGRAARVSLMWRY